MQDETVTLTYDEFRERILDGFIPVENNSVPNDFISFVVNSPVESFIEYFDLANIDDIDYEELENIRNQTLPVIISEIANINNDFSQVDPYGKNSYLHLEKIIQSFGFEKVYQKRFISDKDTLFNFEEFLHSTDSLSSGKEVRPFNPQIDGYPFDAVVNDFSGKIKTIDYYDKDIYYFNKTLGVFWHVRTAYSHYVQESMIYGNLIDKSDFNAVNDLNIEFSPLMHSFVKGFALNVLEMPSYKLEMLLKRYELQNKWLVLPTLDILDLEHFNDFITETNMNNEVLTSMFDHCVEKFNQHVNYFSLEEYRYLYNKIEDGEYPELVKDLFMVEMFLGGYHNCNEYLKVFELNGIKTSFEIMTATVFLIFKHKKNGLKSLNNKDFIRFINKIDKKQLNRIMENKEDLIEIFNVEHIIFEMIDFKINERKLN
jgi:hypothetical protein